MKTISSTLGNTNTNAGQSLLLSVKTRRRYIFRSHTNLILEYVTVGEYKYGNSGFKKKISILDYTEIWHLWKQY